jgi:hypothetical protein
MHMTTKTETRATTVEQPFPVSSTEGNPTTVTRPIAVGYVCAVSDEDYRQQQRVLAAHAASAGVSLAHVVEDPHDSVTLSELLEVADYYGAARMLLPEGAPMAARCRSLADALARIDAVCAVVPATSPSTAEWLDA